MVFKADDKDLLEIYSINNISSITYKDLLYSSESDGKMHILPSFLVVYGDTNKALFLSSRDKHFDEFVKKIKSVYLEEENEVVSNSILGTKKISIDDVSKKILFEGNVDKLNGYETYYGDKDSYDKSLLLVRDRLFSEWDIIKYHLKKSLKRLGVNVQDMHLFEGVIPGKCNIKSIINSEEKINLVEYNTTDNNVHLVIGGLTDTKYPVQMDVNYTRDGIEVVVYIDSKKYYDRTTYTFGVNGLSLRNEVYLDDKLLHVFEDTLEKDSDKSFEKYLTSNDDNISWYRLPWYAHLGISTRKDVLPSSDKSVLEESIVNKNTYYLYEGNEYFIGKEFLTKRYNKRIDDRSLNLEITVDEVKKTLTGVFNKDYIVVETKFSEGSPNGFYKEKLSNKYFYQIYDRNLEELFWASKGEGYEMPADLLDIKVKQKEGN